MSGSCNKLFRCCTCRLLLIRTSINQAQGSEQLWSWIRFIFNRQNKARVSSWPSNRRVQSTSLNSSSPVAENWILLSPGGFSWLFLSCIGSLLKGIIKHVRSVHNFDMFWLLRDSTEKGNALLFLIQALNHLQISFVSGSFMAQDSQSRSSARRPHCHHLHVPRTRHWAWCLCSLWPWKQWLSKSLKQSNKNILKKHITLLRVIPTMTFQNSHVGITLVRMLSSLDIFLTFFLASLLTFCLTFLAYLLTILLTFCLA